MASERSLYRKIQLALDIARRAKPTTAEALCDAVEGRQLPNFNTLQYDQDTDRFVWRQSRTVIRRTVRLCQRLSFLSEEGELTQVGRKALGKREYDRVLGAQVRATLRRSGVVLSDLNEEIRSSLQANPPILPTSGHLWEQLQPQVNQSDFTKFLTLLAHCGLAESSQKKVYLRFI